MNDYAHSVCWLEHKTLGYSKAHMIRRPCLWQSTKISSTVLVSRANRRWIAWQPAGATFELPKDAKPNEGTIASPFGSTGKSAEDRALPSLRQLNEELPTAEELKGRLARGESIDDGKPNPDEEE